MCRTGATISKWPGRHVLRQTQTSYKITTYPEEFLMLSHIMLRNWFMEQLLRRIPMRQLYAQVMNVGDMVHSVYLYCFTNIILTFRRPPDRHFVTENCVVVQRHKQTRLKKVLAFLVLYFVKWYFGAQFQDEWDSSNNETMLNELKTKMMSLMAKDTLKKPHPRNVGGWSSDSVPIVVDTATTRTITPRFEDLIDPVEYKTGLLGIGRSEITHKGRVRWNVMDDSGKTVQLEDNDAYYCAGAPYRLLCPHSWKQCRDEMRAERGETEGDQANIFLADDNTGYIMTWDRGKIMVSVPLDEHTNLPTIYSHGTYEGFKSFASGFRAFPTIIPNDNDKEEEETMKMVEENEGEVSEPDESERQTPQTVSFEDEINQHEKPTQIDDPITHRDEALFMSWHLKLGHVPFKVIRWMSSLGILPKKLQHCKKTICPACMYGKQKRRPWRVKGQAQGQIRKANVPGQCVSVDQLISGTAGLVAQTTGKLTTARYKVATIFVDHYSDLDFVYIQESTSAEETINAKKAFERFAKERGVTIQHYHADNGIFASNGFREEAERCGQGLSFCGVGAHHQNGIAERRIQDLTETARANLIHASHRNEAITAHLWPYALLHASHIRRLLPRDGNMKSPEELFSRAGVRPTTRFLHPFGCPVYVLKGKLQSGGTQPKWEERSRVGVYLGVSRQHATNVSLILNPQTGFISPQFHCVYDDQFDTCERDKNFSKLWAEKAGLQSTAIEDPGDYSQKNVDEIFQVPFVREELNESTVPIVETIEGENEMPTVENDNDEHIPVPEDQEDDHQEPEETVQNEGAQPEPLQEAPRTSRSGRVLRRTQRLEESYMLPRLRSMISEVCHATCEQNKLDDGTINDVNKLHAHAIPASIADNDTMYLREAMQQTDKGEFLKAMVKEIEDHTNRGHWRLTSVDEMRRRNYKHKPIMAIWSFKRKRSPTGEITKYKA